MTITEDRPIVTTGIITLSADELYSIASAAIAASKEDTTPILMAVQVRVENGTLTAVATDRYRVARITFPVEGELAPVTIPRGLLERFTKALKASKTRMAVVTLSVEDTIVTLSESLTGLTMRDSVVYGQYPPVERLIPTEESQFGECESINLNPAYAFDMSKLLHPSLTASDYKNGAPRMRFSKVDNPSRPGPVLFDRTIQDGQGSLEYLLQPNLNRR